MIWMFVIALLAIIAAWTGRSRRVVLALTFIGLLGIAAIFLHLQWGNSGLGL